jgi:preprotein translocase subunit SecY
MRHLLLIIVYYIYDILPGVLRRFASMIHAHLLIAHNTVLVLYSYCTPTVLVLYVVVYEYKQRLRLKINKYGLRLNDYDI